MTKKTIAIVCGGDSSEHDVSLRSAQGLYSFFDKERYNVQKEIKKYNVKAIYAFNVNFDKAMLKNIFGGEFEDLTNLVEFRDIQTAILMTRLMCKKYLDFCYDNNFRTDKGYPQTKAETVYRYLTNNMEFEEAHTGLEDCEIELQILLSAIRSKKKLEFSGHIAWRELNLLAKDLQHPIYVGRSK